MSTVKCPVTGCTNNKESWHLTCAFHWRQVPKATQTKIWGLFRNKPHSDEHRLACLTVLDILNAGITEGAVWP